MPFWAEEEFLPPFSPPPQRTYYIPDVELWIFLGWNSLQFFIESRLSGVWDKNMQKSELEDEEKKI